jgi:predicted methyltransferase
MKTIEEYIRIKKFSLVYGIPINELIRLLKNLLLNKETENYDLVTLTGLSKKSINLFQTQFIKYFENSSKYTKLSPIGIEFANKLVEYVEIIDVPLEGFKNKYEDVQKLISNWELNRPSAKREYDQFLATRETVIKRAALIDVMSDLDDKRILFLGDDDHTSIALGHLNKHREITVLDIDDDMINSIDLSAKYHNVKNLNVFKHDFRNPIPKEFKDSYDVVFTDPPYTTDGVCLFVSRGIEALDKHNKSARLYFCYGNSDLSKEKFIPIYEICVRAGLMIRWTFDKFNHYYGAESIGNASSLFITEATSQIKPLIKGVFKDKMYTNLT